MEFVEEEIRPRFLYRPFSTSNGGAADPNALAKPHPLHVFGCLSIAALLLFFALSLSSQTFSFLLLWLALSLLLAPFAPASSTGGDPRVGRGPPLPDRVSSDPSGTGDGDHKKRFSARRNQSAPPQAASLAAVPKTLASDPVVKAKAVEKEGEEEVEEVEEEREWTDEDLDQLKKQIAKHPAGEPQRWERITESFRGRHGLDSVITTAKSLSERRPGDSFRQFLKQRKPVDKRAEMGDGEAQSGILMENGADSGKEKGWSSGEDLALLSALKAFPKDVPMRWEKIAAAVPGKSKACCMKRVAELKRDFRSSKASEA